MSDPLFESIARIARHEVLARSAAGVGVVEDVHDSRETAPDHAVTIKMRDTGLVLARVPVAVGALGFAATPAVGDLVVVVFLEGDPNAPVVVGNLYHAGADPPDHGAGHVVLRLPPGTSAPNVDLEIVADEPVVRLKLPGDVLLEVAEERIELACGAMNVTVRSGSAGRVKLTAGGTEVDLGEDGDIVCKTPGKLVLQGNEVEISGSTRVKIDGGQVEVN